MRRAHDAIAEIQPVPEPDGFLQGTVEQWTDELTMLAVEHSVDSFVFGPADDPIRQTQVFAAEVAPAVREAVARDRHAPERPAPQPAAATLQQQSRAEILAGRYGDPAEFGSVGAFPFSKQASYVTGTAVRCDGGLVRSL